MDRLGVGKIIAKMLEAAKRLTNAIRDKAGPEIAETHHTFPQAIRDSLGRLQHEDERRAPGIGKIVPDAPTHHSAGAGHPESDAGVRRSVHGPDPTAEDGFLDLPIEEQIRRLEKAHGIRTDADRALEISLFMEDKFRDIALISRQTRPETIFDGPKGWASWLDARLFARKHLDREISMDLIQEIHRRLQIRHNPELAGKMQAGWKLGIGRLPRPLSRHELAAIEENPLLTHIPGPFRTEPHGVVFQPKVEGRPGARDVRRLDAPLTDEEIAAIKNDPLMAYHPPGWFDGQYGLIQFSIDHGMIIYPHFGSVDGMREFHESLCDSYNSARRQPGFDPYQRAAEFQKRFVSAHVWPGEFHGRHSRVLMNFILEQAGKPPSAVAEFDNDLFTSSAEWGYDVAAGGDRYLRWQDKLEQSGGNIDPVDLFDLRPMMQRYQQMGGELSPFTPGETHDIVKYERLHAQLRPGADPQHP
ncbi:hypothetical protein AB0B25_28995 [Nocardia sp. NPDC049190]|uniref:hypothetical protein n=1 Tax=Nocardia sp. NPDC049190 TaxID=3155650 RepID=UPI0033F8D29A